MTQKKQAKKARGIGQKSIESSVKSHVFGEVNYYVEYVERRDS